MIYFKCNLIAASVLALLATSGIWSQADTSKKSEAYPAQYNVTWNSLGKNFYDSMPIGNGDIGLNIWTEQNGQIVFLVGKTDAYTENSQLVKLGRVRVSLSPNPFNAATKFTQTLNVADGEIDISGVNPDSSTVDIRVWVDANNPVAHIEASASKPFTMEARTEIWRLAPRQVRDDGSELWGLYGSPVPIIIDPDTVLDTKGDQVAVCHFNSRSIYPQVIQTQHLEAIKDKYPDPLLHRTFGILLKGPGLIGENQLSLHSAKPDVQARLDLYALTEKADSPAIWSSDIEKLAGALEKKSIETALKAHRKWWREFWDRSYINVSGSPDAEKVSQGYAMQRWMNACGGRGSIPIKFNGSIFTVGEDASPADMATAKEEHFSPDYRAWGECFWAQNQRQVYWPMVMCGDYDLLQPYFKMYSSALPLEIDRIRLAFNHEGAAYPETMYFWGNPNNRDFGWNNPTREIESGWSRYHYTGGVETVAMMCSQYANTRDIAFAKNELVPVADAVVAYFDKHWPRGIGGKIHMAPAQAVETYQGAVNPTTDIAGLKCILPQLLALPKSITTESQRQQWAKVLADLPLIPLGKTTKDGKFPDWDTSDPSGATIILPAEKYGWPMNVENPALYAVFPYRIYGVGKPDLEIARNTYRARRCKSSTCWGQDGEEAALLGSPEAAKNEAIANLTKYGQQRFSWFWEKGYDWIPDMDNGGSGMETLQLMLMQADADGKTIRLIPAWPSDWNCDFKLHAPDRTIVEGSVRDGKLSRLDVTPKSRAKDIVIDTTNQVDLNGNVHPSPN